MGRGVRDGRPAVPPSLCLPRGASLGEVRPHGIAEIFHASSRAFSIAHDRHPHHRRASPGPRAGCGLKLAGAGGVDAHQGHRSRHRHGRPRQDRMANHRAENGLDLGYDFRHSYANCREAHHDHDHFQHPAPSQRTEIGRNIRRLGRSHHQRNNPGTNRLSYRRLPGQGPGTDPRRPTAYQVDDGNQHRPGRSELRQTVFLISHVTGTPCRSQALPGYFTGAACCPGGGN